MRTRGAAWRTRPLTACASWASGRRWAAGLAGLETEIGRVVGELNEVEEDLREIARGIHPAILSECGLGPALRTLARRAAVPVELDVPAMGRLPEPVEVAAYYVCSKAFTNATRYARASVMEVAAGEQDGCLHLAIRDDGVGGADAARGSGLIGLRDRGRGPARITGSQRAAGPRDADRAPASAAAPLTPARPAWPGSIRRWSCRSTSVPTAPVR
jgi:hypothetical protein